MFNYRLSIYLLVYEFFDLSIHPSVFYQPFPLSLGKRGDAKCCQHGHLAASPREEKKMSTLVSIGLRKHRLRDIYVSSDAPGIRRAQCAATSPFDAWHTWAFQDSLIFSLIFSYRKRKQTRETHGFFAQRDGVMTRSPGLPGVFSTRILRKKNVRGFETKKRHRVFFLETIGERSCHVHVAHCYTKSPLKKRCNLIRGPKSCFFLLCQSFPFWWRSSGADSLRGELCLPQVRLGSSTRISPIKRFNCWDMEIFLSKVPSPRVQSSPPLLLGSPNTSDLLLRVWGGSFQLGRRWPRCQRRYWRGHLFPFTLEAGLALVDEGDGRDKYFSSSLDVHADGVANHCWWTSWRVWQLQMVLGLQHNC